MSEYGPDISSYQHGLDLSRLNYASFVIAKCSEGTYYTDADYPGWRLQAAALKLPMVWYHFLSTEEAGAQAAHTLACVGDVTLPGMLDFEKLGNTSPTLAEMLAYIDAAHHEGLNLRLLYLPHWYWQQLGSPDLSGVAARGVHLISSSYPGGSGTPQQLYPGDSAAGWAPYGGLTPLLYQFTNQASDGGQLLDYNAFRGSAADLASALQFTPNGDTTMGTIPPSIGQKWPDIADQFPANQSFTDETALIWADGGARAAALYALQARDGISALAARFTPPDPAAIAAAVAAAVIPHIPAPTVVDTNAIAAATAAALEAHGLPTVDAAVLAEELAGHFKVV